MKPRKPRRKVLLTTEQIEAWRNQEVVPRSVDPNNQLYTPSQWVRRHHPLSALSASRVKAMVLRGELEGQAITCTRAQRNLLPPGQLTVFVRDTEANFRVLTGQTTVEKPKPLSAAQTLRAAIDAWLEETLSPYRQREKFIEDLLEPTSPTHSELNLALHFPVGYLMDYGLSAHSVKTLDGKLRQAITELLARHTTARVRLVRRLTLPLPAPEIINATRDRLVVVPVKSGGYRLLNTKKRPGQ